MDWLADFQHVGPQVLPFLARNSAVVTVVLVVAGAAWRPVTEDDFRRPRELYAALFGKGSSDGRGDVPRE